MRKPRAYRVSSSGTGVRRGAHEYHQEIYGDGIEVL